MEKKIICAVSGRSITEIGNGHSETYYKNIDIKLAIADKITEFAKNGVTDFLCNAEYGFPLWACEIIIGLRDIRIQQGLPSFRLHIVMPWEEHGSDLSDNVHERLYDVYAKADSVLMLYRRYHDKCYENSERFMIDHCNFLYTDDKYDFAAQYAELHKKPIVVCQTLERV